MYILNSREQCFLNHKSVFMNKDVVLLQQLKEGSYKAFTLLYEEYFDLLYGFVFSLTRSHNSTTEIVQETFIKVWVYRSKIDVDLPFKAWLYSMAKNLMFDQLRKQFRTPLFEDYLIHVSNESLSVDANEGSFDFHVFQQALAKTKRKLSPRQAEVFELCKEQGLSVEEVVRRLNISEQAVYNYLSQAMKIIREDLSPFMPLLVLFFAPF